MSADAPAEPAAAPEKKGGLPIKTIAIVLIMLVVEAVGLVAVLTMFGKPSEVKGVDLKVEEHSVGDEMGEIPIVAEKFTNSSSGRVWVWSVEVVAVAKQKHAGADEAADGKKDAGGHGGEADGDEGGHGGSATVRAELKAKMAKVRTGIGAIFSSAQHSYFTEPGRETLSRQVLQFLREVFGQDAEGEERIRAVLIPNCLGFPADY